MTTVIDRRVARRPEVATVLRPPALSRWVTVGIGAAAVLAAVVVRGLAGWSGWNTTAVCAAAAFVLARTTASLFVEGRRRAVDGLATTFVASCLVAAITPLVLILGYIVMRGAPVLSASFFTHSMSGVTGEQPGGGVYHALVGTVEQVGLAAVVALPLGILTAVYLVEFGRGRFARAVTFFVDVMAGVPSIVAGLFVFSFLLLGFGIRPFGAAGSVALAILMLPIVIRSAEEMIRLVPDELREASAALGQTHWRTVVKVVLPTALSGLITGSMLAIARVAGETAPLILLVGYSAQINRNPWSGDQASLPVMIWDQLGKRSGNAGEFAEPRAWGAALVLVALICVLNAVARLVAAVMRRPNRKG